MAINSMTYSATQKPPKMNGSTVLIADDDASIRTVLSQALARAGFQVRSTSNASTLWKWVKEQEGDLVLTDVMMPDGSVFDFLPKIRMERPKLPIIVMSAQNNLLTAISAAEQGAYEYLPKPFDLEKMIDLVKKALEPVSEHRAVVQKRKAQNDENLPLIGRSASMQEVYRTLSRVAGFDLTVLIEGEVGVGKKLIARTIHDFSGRKSSPFTRISVAGFSETFELEQLFLGKGLKGDGILDNTQGGTLLIDDINDAPLSTQARLAHILNGIDEYDIRLIVSSNVPLRQLVSEGKFRSDLFNLVSVVQLKVPPLRERISDIGDLARLFLERASKKGVGEKVIDKSAIEELEAWSWPGNVRELENLMLRLAVLNSQNVINGNMISSALLDAKTVAVTKGTDEEADLPSLIKASLISLFAKYKSDGQNLQDLHSMVVRSVEKPLFELTLKETRGNQIRAAEILGLNRNTLRKRLTEFEIN